MTNVPAASGKPPFMPKLSDAAIARAFWEWQEAVGNLTTMFSATAIIERASEIEATHPTGGAGEARGTGGVRFQLVDAQTYAMSLLRDVDDELRGIGSEPCLGSMAPIEDLHGRIAAFLETGYTHPAPKQEGGDVSTARLIEILRGYRCVKQQLEDDGGGLPLVDALTPTWAKTIADGEYEIEMLADHIAGELATLTAASTDGGA